MKNTMIDFELLNGKKVQLTLNFKKMLFIRSKKEEEYKHFNKIMMDGMQDLFDHLDVMYMGYLCASDDIEKAMTKEEFYDLVPSNMMDISRISTQLVYPKKQTDSEKPSEGIPENDQNE